MTIEKVVDTKNKYIEKQIRKRGKKPKYKSYPVLLELNRREADGEYTAWAPDLPGCHTSFMDLDPFERIYDELTRQITKFAVCYPEKPMSRRCLERHYMHGGNYAVFYVDVDVDLYREIFPQEIRDFVEHELE